ncbi:DUF72 domain-containing protein [Pedobacter sp. GR22-6]|uniref:DUF72 domain-containing protein n=1 Tax=Pedobacter sp. GR22-6 TaxID=3127957 RepID=UPI00307EC61E
MIQYLIGCSGFHYRHWRGKFYPEKLAVKNWFDFYCQRFSTLELNVTFYRFPKLATLRQWYERAPDDFLFSVKVPRSITHFKKLNDTSNMMADFYGLVQEGLQDKLGNVLFQFPPNFSASDAHVERIISAVNPCFENVAEFRHPSWWDAQVISRLGAHQVAFCGMSHPDFPTNVVGNTRRLYYRMHGREALYSSGYAEQELSDLVSKVERVAGLKRAYIYFNNDVQGFATVNAEMFLKMTREQSEKRRDV